MIHSNTIEALKELSNPGLEAGYIRSVIETSAKQLLMRYPPSDWDLVLICRGGALLAKPADELGYQISCIDAVKGEVCTGLYPPDFRSRLVLCDVLCDTAKTMIAVRNYLVGRDTRLTISFASVLSTDPGLSRLEALGTVCRIGAIGPSSDAVAASCDQIPYDFGEVAKASGALSRVQLLRGMTARQ